MSMDEGDAPSGYCEQCSEPCTAILEDFGIGAYEFWGSKETHVDERWVSPCCEAEVVKDKPDNESEGDDNGKEPKTILATRKIQGEEVREKATKPQPTPGG